MKLENSNKRINEHGIIIAMTGTSGNMGKEALRQTLESEKVKKVKILLTEKPRNTVYARKLKKKYGSRIEIVRGDIAEKELCKKLTEGTDLVVNMAAVIPPKSDHNEEESFACNVKGAKNMTDAIKGMEKQAVFVHISSVAVYGNRDMSIRDFYSEKVPVEISLFRNCGKEYRAAICDEIKKVKEMRYALYSFVSSCFVASGKFPQVTWDSMNTAKELVDNFVSYEIDTTLKGFISNFVPGKTSMLEFYNKIDFLDSKLKEIGIRATKYFAAEYSTGKTQGKIIKKMDPKTGVVRSFDYSVPKECNICLARIKKIFNNKEESE